MSRGAPVKGFVYSRQLPGRATSALADVRLPFEVGSVLMYRPEWRDMVIRPAIESGGFTRREAGETFIHDRTGKIVAEAYALIPDPKVPT